MTETTAPYPTKTHRAFIALPAPPRVSRALRLMAADFAKALPVELLPHFRREEGGYHITLRFLGNCTQDQLRALIATDIITRPNDRDVGIPPFTLRPSGVAAFENLPRHTIYAGVAGDTELLEALQEKIAAIVVDPGGMLDMVNPFHPHITLGWFAMPLRHGQTWDVKAVSQATTKTSELWRGHGPFEWCVTGAAIMESVRTMGKVEYRILSEGRLSQ